MGCVRACRVRIFSDEGDESSSVIWRNGNSAAVAWRRNEALALALRGEVGDGAWVRPSLFTLRVCSLERLVYGSTVCILGSDKLDVILPTQILPVS